MFCPHKKNPALSFDFFVCTVVNFWFENVLVCACPSLGSCLPFVPIHSDVSEMGIFHQFLFAHAYHQTHMNLPELRWQKEQNGLGGSQLRKKRRIFSAIKPKAVGGQLQIKIHVIHECTNLQIPQVKFVSWWTLAAPFWSGLTSCLLVELKISQRLLRAAGLCSLALCNNEPDG